MLATTVALHTQVMGLLTAAAVAGAPYARAWVLARLGPKRLAQLADVAHVAVHGAEQLAAGIPGTTSTQKMDYAASVVDAGAKRLGVKLSSDEVLALVHQAVEELKTVQAVAAGPVHEVEAETPAPA